MTMLAIREVDDDHFELVLAPQAAVLLTLVVDATVREGRSNAWRYTPPLHRDDPLADLAADHGSPDVDELYLPVTWTLDELSDRGASTMTRGQLDAFVRGLSHTRTVLARARGLTGGAGDDVGLDLDPVAADLGMQLASALLSLGVDALTGTSDIEQRVLGLDPDA